MLGLSSRPLIIHYRVYHPFAPLRRGNGSPLMLRRSFCGSVMDLIVAICSLSNVPRNPSPGELGDTLFPNRYVGDNLSLSIQKHARSNS